MGSESRDVIVGTRDRVRSTEFSESDGEPFDQFREFVKMSQFYIGRSGSHSGDKECHLNRKGSHTKQNKNIPVPGAKTKAPEPELKSLLQSYVFALKCEHARSTARHYSHSSRWQQGAMEGLLK